MGIVYFLRSCRLGASCLRSGRLWHEGILSILIQVWKVVIILNIDILLLFAVTEEQVLLRDGLLCPVHLDCCFWLPLSASGLLVFGVSFFQGCFLFTKLLGLLEFLLIFFAPEVKQEVLRDGVFILDVENRMQLLIGPKQVLVYLQKGDLIQFREDGEGMSLATTVLEQLTHLSLRLLRHSKVDDEVKLAEAWGVEARHHEIHLIQLVPWESILSSELIVVQLLFDEVRDQPQHHRELLLCIVNLLQRLLAFVELACQGCVFVPLLLDIPAATSATSSSTSSSATTTAS